MSNITFIYKDFDASLTTNYNKIWNWYLNNVKEGEFERILNNPEYRMGLNEFIDNIVDTDITLLMIIPNIINSTVLLQDLLTKFFIESSSNESNEVIITNLGPLAQSQSSIIMAQNRVNNLDIKSNQFSFGPISSQNQTIELNSIISGESGYTPSLISPINDNNQSPNKQDDDLYADESSIDSYRPQVSLPPSPKYSLTRVSTIQNEESLTHVPNTPRSSVSSFSEPRSPIIQIESKESKESEEEEEEGEDEDYEDVQSSSIMGDVEDHDSLQSIYSNNSLISIGYVPSIITTRTEKLNIRYKLILKNILFRDDLRNKRTAIRQVDDHGISDDWLLYDEHFRMDNLELFELSDIIEMMHNEKRILFYDLVLEKVSNSNFDEEDEDHQFPDEKELSVVEFNGKSSNEEIDSQEGQSIRFVQSNTATMTPQDTIQLSKTNTIKTNYGSIKSDVDLYKPDTLFSRVERSKSTPINTKRKFKLKHHNSLNNEKCIIM